MGIRNKISVSSATPLLCDYIAFPGAFHWATVETEDRAFAERDFPSGLAATEMAMSDPGREATRIVTGSFLFSSQGSFRVGWISLLVPEGLGYTSLDAETLSWGGPGPQECSLEHKGCFPSVPPMEWLGTGWSSLLMTTLRRGGVQLLCSPCGNGERQHLLWLLP